MVWSIRRDDDVRPDFSKLTLWGDADEDDDKWDDYPYDIDIAESLEQLREYTNDFTHGVKMEEYSEDWDCGAEMTEYEFKPGVRYLLYNNSVQMMRLYYEVLRTVDGKRTRLNMLQQVESKFGKLEHTEDFEEDSDEEDSDEED